MDNRHFDTTSGKAGYSQGSSSGKHSMPVRKDPQPVDLSDLVRVATAARMKGVDRQTIQYHIDKGNLQIMEIDGVVFVKRSDVSALKLVKRTRRSAGA
jgi:hypothetical protein